jgi:formylglycine-generating enzyme required for sulfatase activity
MWALAAEAGGIGLNINADCDNFGAGATLANSSVGADEVVGIGEQNHWNNTGAADCGCLDGLTFSGSLVDSANVVQSGLSISFWVPGGCAWQGMYLAGDSALVPTTPTEKLFKAGFFGGDGVRVDVSGVAYDTFDVVVYGHPGAYTLVVGGADVATKTIDTCSDYSQLKDAGANGGDGNCVIFAGVTSSAFQVRCQHFDFGGVNAIQVTQAGGGGAPGTLLSVPAADGGGVAHDFHVAPTETPTADYVAFLNAQAGGQIAVSSGVVSLVAATVPLCLTTTADADAAVAYDGAVFSAATNRADHPMTHVTWFGAAAYCNWKSAQDGLIPVYVPAEGWTASLTNSGYRLPTEAEWRKAAAWNRKTLTFYRYGTSANTLEKNAANFLNSGDAWETQRVRTSPVGSRTGRSPYWIFDASGNVWEWCHDLYSPQAQNPATDAHALRGGGWGNLATDCATDVRIDNKPGAARNSVGFRIVRND